jgi:hypothetical protein
MPRAGASARIVPATTAPAFSFERGLAAIFADATIVLENPRLLVVV